MEMVMRSYPNDWVAESIMYRNGVGGGSSGKTHELTEEKQGTYLYTIGPYADPVLTIDPGDQVIVETRDAFRRTLGPDHERTRRTERNLAELDRYRE